jgi:hypothetical protein
MPMVGQQHGGQQVKWMVRSDFGDGFAMAGSAEFCCQNRTTVVRNTGEEKRAAGNEITSECRHYWVVT